MVGTVLVVIVQEIMALLQLVEVEVAHVLEIAEALLILAGVMINVSIMVIAALIIMMNVEMELLKKKVMRLLWNVLHIH